MEFQGTKGKWSISNENIVTSDEQDICTVNIYLEAYADVENAKQEKICKANTTLIASAPELLEVLFELVSLKKWKDEFGKDEWYLEKQPIAWKKAQKLLEKTLI